MKVTTFSIVAGGKACNARCPFCISQMTGFGEVCKPCKINETNFHKAARLAQIGGTTTVLITGKGEPLLYPSEITQYLRLLKPYSFPFVELQTNGLEIGRLASGDKKQRKGRLSEAMLKRWHTMGLNTIALSTVHYENAYNSQVYRKDYPDLATTIAYLHKLGFTVRLCVMMLQGYIDTPEKVMNVVNWCRKHRVEQLTVRPINKPDGETASDSASRYVMEHGLTKAQSDTITNALMAAGTPVMYLAHGATVLDIGGQNVCVTNCLTVPTAAEEIRTLIFYSSGLTTYAWQYPGAILLGGNGNE